LVTKFPPGSVVQ